MIVRLLPIDAEVNVAAQPRVHLVTFAEAGFSMLDGYMRGAGLDVDDVARFADEVNRRDDPGSLAPRLNLSAIPRHCIRVPPDRGSEECERVLAEHVGRVLEANRASPKLQFRRVHCDFRSPAVEPWVPRGVFRAAVAHGNGILEELAMHLPGR